MPEEVIWDSKARLITVRAWGHGTIEEWQASRRRFIELHEQFGASQVLVDVREQLSAPPIAYVFEFGTDWPSALRLAIVVAERTEETQLFLQMVASNRGKQVRVFLTVEEAMQWLDATAEKPGVNSTSGLNC